MEIRLGAEVHITGVNDPPHESLCALAIEGTKCVLFEFPFLTEWSGGLIDAVGDFAADTGYKPIIAHAERYAEIRQEPSLLTAFAEMGCYVQLNTRAFLEKNSKGFAFAALKNGLVHCLGTDAHDAQIRRPDYEQAKLAVCAAGYGEEWENVQETMRKIWAGETPSVSFGMMKKTLGFYR